MHRIPIVLGAVVAAAVLLRVLFIRGHLAALPLMRTPDQDAAFYDSWARALAAGGVFLQGPYPMAPGYPVFLSIVYRMLGPDPLAAVGVQAALGVLTVLLTGLLALRLFGPREAATASVLVLGNGALYFYEGKLLGATLAVFLATASVFLAVHAERRGSGPWWTAAGLAAGLLAVVRSNMLLVGGLVLLFLVLRGLRRRDPARRAALYATGLLVALLPTIGHNANHGALLPVAANGGLNLYIGNHRAANGSYVDPPGFTGLITNQAAEADSVVLSETGRVLDPATENRYWTGRALEEIRSDPRRWLVLLGRKLQLLVNRHEETNNGSYAFEASRVPILRYAPVSFNLLAILGVLGLAVAIRSRPGPLAPRGSLAAPTAVLLAVAVSGLLFFVLARFRLPAVPVLAVFSAVALVRALDAARARRWTPVAAGAAVVLLFGALTWANPLGGARNPAWEAGLLARSAGEALERGDAPEARRIYMEALDLDPANADIRLQLGQLEAAAGRLSEALAHFERAARARPDDFALLNNMGILQFNLRRYADCVATLERAIALDSEAAAPRLYQGLAYRSLGRPAEAGPRLAEALERDPSLRPAYIALIEIRLNAGRMEEARDLVARARASQVELPGEVLGAVR